MIFYYYCTTLLTLINLIFFIYTFEGKKVNSLLLLLNLLMLVSNLGYLAKAISRILPEAIVAIKICYVGGCFIPPILLYTICCIANIEVKGWIKSLTYLYSFVVFGFVLTIGYSPIWYKHAYLTRFFNTTVLVAEHAKLYFLFIIEMYGNMCSAVFVLLYSFIKKNTISRKTVIIIVAIELLNLILYFFGGIFDDKIEIMPIIYVFDGWFLLYLQRTVTMYNIEDAINGSKRDNGIYGYIVFNKNKKFMGCNSSFLHIYPEFSSTKIDLPCSKLPNNTLFSDALEKFEKEGKTSFSVNKDDKHYTCTVEYISQKENNIGYIIEFREDTDRYKYLQILTSNNDKLEEQVKLKTEHILDIQNRMVLGMANMVENRDENTGGHIRRTSGIIKILLDTITTNNMFKIDEEFCEDLIKAAPMHDLGKISIDDHILRKPGKLNDEEYAIIKTHAAKSAELVKEILEDVEEDHFVLVATNVARHHHERWDGTGYPDSLKGDEIPFEARIMAVADVYDALVSKRCYKEAMSFEDASKIMLESMGNHFDPKLKEVFLLSQKRLENYYYYDR